jgi:hypothetical protein
MMSLLSKRITSHLEKVVGLKLTNVYLFCFEYEIDHSAMAALPFYFGGEVILIFEGEQAVVTWDQRAGWKDHFSLYVGRERLYLPTSSLVKWDVSQLDPWQNCISQKLTSAQVYSQNETPHVVKFNFGNTQLFIGDSAEMRFGDGDDVLVAKEIPENAYGQWDMIWQASSVA